MVFKFNFDLQTVTDLRVAMNENTFLALNKVNHLPTKPAVPYQSWGRMCAAMDRIEDTMQYINNLILGERPCTIAFDFYDFVNNMYIVVENIKIMASIFNVDYDCIEKEQSSFHLIYPDGEWFSYVRSLCSVHPTDTTERHHRKIMQNEIMGCCARVVWDTAHGLTSGKPGDLAAIVYNFPKDISAGVPDFEYNFIPLVVSEFENYLQRWLDFIPAIIKAIHDYNDTKYEEFRKNPIKKLDACKDDLERLIVLQKEYNLRFGDNIDEIFDFYVAVFTYHLSDETNRALLEKYKQAIRLSMQFLYNALQNMSFEGFENSGLQNDKTSFLFYELYYANTYSISTLKEYGYHLSKLHLLNSRSYFEQERIRHLLDEMITVANRYVVFTNSETGPETLILMQMVIYFAALESHCCLNKNIPNELQYRKRLLSQEEIDDLAKEYIEEPATFTDTLPDDLKDLFE